MSGEKEPLLVIGKAARPRAFKKLNISSLPVLWRHNNKAWMTRDIMNEWLSELDRKMSRQRRKILLFMDNACSHPVNLKLKNVKIMFLPPNTTAFCQPLDQGIIRNFKVLYRQLLLRHILSIMDQIKSNRELSKEIDMLEAIYFINNAWQKVSADTIKNCFLKAGFRKKANENGFQHFEAEDDLPLSVLAEMLKLIKTSNINVDDFVAIDQHLPTEDEEMSIANITKEHDNLIEDVSDDDANNVEDDVNLGSFEEALIVTEKLKRFAKYHEDYKGFELAKHLETHFQKTFVNLKQANLRQTNLLDFFRL